MAELGGAKKRITQQAGRVIGPAGELQDPAFARQVLARASLVEGVGPSELADAILRSLGDDEEALLSGRAVLHVFPPDFMRRGSARPDAHPLASAVHSLRDVLGAKIAGRARKRGVEPTEGVADRMVQVLLVDGWRAWCASSSLPPEETSLTSWPVPFPAGHAHVSGYEDAPSSAYRKLVEALSWMRVWPTDGDLVLDLGAAPGGWSYVALENGARVTAYDRADLDRRVASHPLITHVRQDAFANAPLEDATWVLCDVIDTPERSLDLVERALATASLRALVITVKLKPPISLGPVEKAKRIIANAASRGWVGRVKHLLHNKHEVTVMARRAREPASPPVADDDDQ